MRDKPVNLNLFHIRFPVTAIASILHRMSGVILFFLIPVFLGMLQTILFFPELFDEFKLNRIMLFSMLSVLLYHLLAGIRHLLMDCGYGESKEVARISAYLVLILTFTLSLLLGYALCY